MAWPAPQEITDEELMSKSVMQEPKGYLRRILDFAIGSSPSERFTTGLTPGFGSIVTGEGVGLRGLVEKAKNLLPKRILTAAEGGPENLIVKAVPPEAMRSPTYAAQYVPETKTAEIKNSMLARSDEGYLAKLIGHELTHGAQDLKGVLREGPPGLGMEKVAKSFYWPGYNLEQEKLPWSINYPSYVEAPSTMGEVQAALRWLEEKLGRSPIEIQRKRYAMRATERGGLPTPERMQPKSTGVESIERQRRQVLKK